MATQPTVSVRMTLASPQWVNTASMEIASASNATVKVSAVNPVSGQTFQPIPWGGGWNAVQGQVPAHGPQTLNGGHGPSVPWHQQGQVSDQWPDTWWPWPVLTPPTPVAFSWYPVYTKEIIIDIVPEEPGPVEVINVDVGLDIEEIEDVPPDPVVVPNVVGYQVTYTLDDWYASRSLDESLVTAWKSSPQPFAHSVVPFYVDLRDEYLGSQVIDSLDLVPLYGGPTMTVYYSNDDTIPGKFLLGRRTEEGSALDPTVLYQAGLLGTGSDFSGTLFWGKHPTLNPVDPLVTWNDAESAGASPNTSRIELASDYPWSMGLTFEPNFIGGYAPYDSMVLSQILSGKYWLSKRNISYNCNSTSVCLGDSAVSRGAIAPTVAEGGPLYIGAGETAPSLDWEPRSLYLPGSNHNHAYLDNTPDLNDTTRVFVRAVPVAGWRPAATSTIVGQWDTGQRVFRLQLLSDGTLKWEWSSTGSDAASLSSTASVPSDAEGIGIVWIPDNGATQKEVEFLYIRNGETLSLENITSGTAATVNTSSTEMLRIGCDGGGTGNKWSGTVSEVCIAGVAEFLPWSLTNDGIRRLALPGGVGDGMACTPPAEDPLPLDVSIWTCLDDYAVEQELIGIDESWVLGLNTGGYPMLTWWDTAVSGEAASSVAVPAISGSHVKMRATVHLSGTDGIVRFYYSFNPDPSPDSPSWILLDELAPIANMAIDTSLNQLVIGSPIGVNPPSGFVTSAVVRYGIGLTGDKLASPDMSDTSYFGDTSGLDKQANTWVATGVSVIEESNPFVSDRFRGDWTIRTDGISVANINAGAGTPPQETISVTSTKSPDGAENLLPGNSFFFDGGTIVTAPFQDGTKVMDVKALIAPRSWAPGEYQTIVSQWGAEGEGWWIALKGDGRLSFGLSDGDIVEEEFIPKPSAGPVWVRMTWQPGSSLTIYTSDDYDVTADAAVWEEILSAPSEISEISTIASVTMGSTDDVSAPEYFHGRVYSVQIRSGSEITNATASLHALPGDEEFVASGRTWTLTDGADVISHMSLTNISSGVSRMPIMSRELFQTVVAGSLSLGDQAEGFVRGLWVRQEEYSDLIARAYSSNPRQFVEMMGPSGKTKGDYNCLLLARLQGDSIARVGRNDEAYELKNWVPVYRDFRLRRGTVPLPTIRAKYLKLEFSDLVARPYPMIRSKTRQYLDFPRDIHGWHSEVADTGISQYDRADIDVSRMSEGLSAIIHDNTRWDPDHPPTGTAMRFDSSGRHAYDRVSVNHDTQQAYFVGLCDIKAYRGDPTFSVDTPKYYETMLDQVIVDGSASNMTWDPEGQVVRAMEQDEFIVTKILNSPTNVLGVQLAVHASEWESQFNDRQISLFSLGHIERLAGTMYQDVSDLVEGEGAGMVLKLTPGSPGLYDEDGTFDEATSYNANYDLTTNFGVNTIGEYGIRTKAGLYQYGIGAEAAYDTGSPYDAEAPYDSGYLVNTEDIRMAGIARIMLPETSNGTYSMRLYAEQVVVAEKHWTNLPVRKWLELELPWFSDNAIDLQIEIAQIDVDVAEPYYVDLLSIFQNPIHWQFSTNGGVAWTSIMGGINDPNAIAIPPAPGNELMLKATAMRAGAYINSFLLVPWYDESPSSRRVPVDYLSPLGVSEWSDLRAPEHEPMFKLWHRPWPQRYSLNQPGRVPVTGDGVPISSYP